MKNILLFVLLATTLAVGQTAHIKGSHLEHSALWQCHYDVEMLPGVIYLTTHNGNYNCADLLPTGYNAPLLTGVEEHWNGTKIKVRNIKGKEMTLDVIGTRED